MAASTIAKSFEDVLHDLETLISARKEVPDGQKLSDNIARMIEDSSRQLNNLYQSHISDDEPSCQDHSLLLGVHDSIGDIPVAAKILDDLLKSEVIARRVVQLTPPGCKDFQIHRSLQKIWESLQSGNVQDKAIKQAVIEAFNTHSSYPTPDTKASRSRGKVQVPGSEPPNDQIVSGSYDRGNVRRAVIEDNTRRSVWEVPSPEPMSDKRVSDSRGNIEARRSERPTKGATKDGWSVPVSTVRFPDKLLWGECLAVVYDAARGILVAQDVDKPKAKVGSGVEIAFSRLTHLYYSPTEEHIQLHCEGRDKFVIDIKMHSQWDGSKLIKNVMGAGPKHLMIQVV
ncbi:MAG: hypothetical protein Q9208_007504 [Pyrenodesmia sp. 3 TL-2023]